MTSTLLVGLLYLLTSQSAQAYVGPGPGLSMIGSFFTLIGGIFIALLMILIYPLRIMLKRRRAQKAQTDNSQPPQT